MSNFISLAIYKMLNVLLRGYSEFFFQAFKGLLRRYLINGDEMRDA